MVRPYRRRFVSFVWASLCAAGRRARRMRPAFPPPPPPCGCRRRRSSIDGDPSFSIHLSLFCSTGFHRLPRSYEEIRLLHGHRLVVVASFRPTARDTRRMRDKVPLRDRARPPRVRYSGFAAAPVPLTAPTSVGFGRSTRRHARRSARPAQGFACVRCCSAL